LNPSVPPSTIGIIEDVIGAPSASYSESTKHIGYYSSIVLKLARSKNKTQYKIEPQKEIKSEHTLP
jgi:hypothetical protein